MTPLRDGRLLPVAHRPLGGVDDGLRLCKFLSDSYALAGGEFNWEPRDWAERHLALTEEDGARVLHTWAFDWDADRRDRLVGRGYTPVPGWSWQNRRRRTSRAVEPRPVAAGYALRNVDDSLDDATRWVDATNAVFGHSTPVEDYCSFLGSPSFDPTLHIVVEAPDGSVAAFAGLTIDTANKVATLEPVGTRDGHRRLGLAQAAISEGLRRVADRGVEVVHVANWGTADAGHLYGSLGFEHYTTQTAWRTVVARAKT